MEPKRHRLSTINCMKLGIIEDQQVSLFRGNHIPGSQRQRYQGNTAGRNIFDKLTGELFRTSRHAIIMTDHCQQLYRVGSLLIVSMIPSAEKV